VVVVGVGDELLFGQTVDTNGAWLSRELSDMGFRVHQRRVVPDSQGQIQDAVARGLEEAELVILTGGLGPTSDDLTRPAVAEALGTPLEEDPDLVEYLRNRFKAFGYDELPPTNRRMAQVPRGARILRNPVGAAPGLALEGPGEGWVALLPGPPREMKGVFSDGLRPLLHSVFGQRLAPTYHRIVHTTGIPESLLAQKIESLLPADMGPVSLAYLPDLRGVRLRFSVRGLSPEEASVWVDRVEQPLREFLSAYRFQSETGDLAQALGDRLLRNQASLAVAESCTGGLIGKRITDHPGSSRYFLGGVLAYDNRIKVQELGVPEDLLLAEGAVSQVVAEAMAKGVAERFGADAGIGITGIAGPGGGSEEKPVGMVWISATFRGEITSRKETFPGSREEVRERGAQAALALLYRFLRERGR
jgi:nicotinamide-nucleotide amidase